MTWKVMKEVIGLVNKNEVKQKSHHFLHENIKYTDSIDIANLFNDFFVSVGSSLADKIPATDII